MRPNRFVEKLVFQFAITYNENFERPSTVFTITLLVFWSKRGINENIRKCGHAGAFPTIIVQLIYGLATKLMKWGKSSNDRWKEVDPTLAAHAHFVLLPTHLWTCCKRPCFGPTATVSHLRRWDVVVTPFSRRRCLLEVVKVRFRVKLRFSLVCRQVLPACLYEGCTQVPLCKNW